MRQHWAVQVAKWHAEVTAIVLRRYENLEDHEAYKTFDAVAHAVLCGPGEVFIEGALTADGKPISMSDWRQLGLLLLQEHGIHTVRADRRGKIVEFSTKRALLQARKSNVHQTDQEKK